MAKKTPPSRESVRLAQIAFGRLDYSVTACLNHAARLLGLRKPSAYPHSPTRLLLQAAHQVNTKT